MARFRFKIVDSQGRRRSGVLRAESREVAETALRSKLCQIEELAPLDGEGTAVDVGRLTESFSYVDRLRKLVAFVAACVLVVSLYAGWRQFRSEPIPEVSNEEVKFTVKGRIKPSSLPRGAQPGSVTVHASFPDLVYQVEGKLSPDGTSFELPVHLVGNARPERMVLELSVDGEPGRWPIPSGTRVLSGGGDVVVEEAAVDREQAAAAAGTQPPAPAQVALADKGTRQKAIEGRNKARAKSSAKQQRGSQRGHRQGRGRR